MTGASNPSESQWRPEWHFCLSVLLCEFCQCASVAAFFLFLVCLLPAVHCTASLDWFHPHNLHLSFNLILFSCKVLSLVSWVLLQNLTKCHEDIIWLIFTFKGCVENVITWILLKSGISWIPAQKAFTSDTTNRLSVCVSNKGKL